MRQVLFYAKCGVFVKNCGKLWLLFCFTIHCVKEHKGKIYNSVSQTSKIHFFETYKITHIKITTLQFSRVELVFASENMTNVL